MKSKLFLSIPILLFCACSYLFAANPTLLKADKIMVEDENADRKLLIQIYVEATVKYQKLQDSAIPGLSDEIAGIMAQEFKDRAGK